MSAFAWAVAFVLMVVGLGGSAVTCVAIVERGQTKRALESEQTKRTGMENAFQLEFNKLKGRELGAGSPSAADEFTYESVEDIIGRTP